jgi:UDP-GlcNAc:undecaprenyl-phosphate/decaprenyl-phosphate GlcNAc-1-phosphate transferase
VLILWTWTALLSAVVLFPTYTGRGDALIPAGVAALAVVLYTLFGPGLRSRRATSAEPPPAAPAPPPERAARH